jgi:L,D-peptidoglycan transpeptidase YkuD (ErfK/YbiS/YcfS/YnhG family)
MTTNQDKLSDRNDKVGELQIVSGSSAILNFAGRHLPAIIGRGGVRADKYEGDGGTPPGLLPLRRILYRSDRLDAPITSLRCEPLTENDGWCDDVTHPDYNCHIQLPHPARHERLWLENHLYDIIGIFGYNDDPIVSGQGSAIFLHVARFDMQPTDGCIALTLNDLQWVLKQGLEAIFVPN